MEKFLTTKEVSEMLHLPLWKVQELIRNEELPVMVYSKRTRRVPLSKLRRWMVERFGQDVLEA